MNTTIFDNCIGKAFESVNACFNNDWNNTYSDKYTHILKNEQESAIAIILLDDDGFVRYCDVKKKRNGEKYKSIYLYSGLFTMSTHKDIKNVYKIISDKRFKDYRIPLCTQADFRVACRNIYHRPSKDRLSVPVSNNKKVWRTIADPEGDTSTDFIIIPDNGQTKEEIEQFVYDTVYCPSNYCYSTGRVITLSWDYKKLPCGIAIIHRTGIDW